MNQKRFLMFPVKTERQPVLIEKVLFVDPGIDGFGWAFFEYVVCKSVPRSALNGCHFPDLTGQYIPKGKAWEGRVRDSWSWFAGIVAQVEPREVVIEFPEFWTGAIVSHTAMVRGDLFKLSFQIGGFAQICIAAGTNEPIFIEPKIWKGQLPKPVMMNRLKDLFAIKGKAKWGSHEADSIGMGMSAQGVL